MHSFTVATLLRDAAFQQPSHHERASQASVPTAVVIAPQPFDLEAGRSVERDRTRVVNPDLKFKLVRTVRFGMVQDRLKERSPAALSARVAEDGHSEVQDPRDLLSHPSVADDSASIIQYP